MPGKDEMEVGLRVSLCYHVVIIGEGTRIEPSLVRRQNVIILFKKKKKKKKTRNAMGY